MVTTVAEVQRRINSKRKKNEGAVVVAKRALRIARGLKNTREEKYFIREYSASLVTTTGTITWLHQIPQGDTSITRDGNQVFLKGMTVRGSLRLSVSEPSSAIRMIVFRGHADNGQAIPWVISGDSGGILRISDYLSDYNVDTLSNRTVIWDKTFRLNSNWSGQAIELNFHKTFKLTSKLKFSDTSNLYESGGYYLALIGSETTNGVTFDAIFRTTFHDS